MQNVLDLSMMLIAFGGGVFGAAIGALPSFIFCGFLVIVGEAIVMAGGVATITSGVAFGPFFGPHVAFAGGAAAAAYAARKGILSGGREIATPLMQFGQWEILLVGGIFGAIGYLINALLVAVGTPTDTVALTVVLSALIVRMVWGQTGIFGTHNLEHSSSRWQIPDAEAWIPFQKHRGQLLMIGLGVGVLSSYIALLTGSPVIGFGIVAASLLISLIVDGTPVSHHIALPAALAAIATGNLVVGVLFGILGAFAGELYARIFYSWGDTFIDPPAAAIATLSTVVALFL